MEEDATERQGGICILLVKIAVPAQEERLRGAQSASELARAGTIEVRASDGLSCDRLMFGYQPHPQRATLYTC